MIRLRFLLSFLTIIVLWIVLAWISNEFGIIKGWTSYLWIISLGAGILLLGWCGVHSDRLIGRNTQILKSQPTNPDPREEERRITQPPTWLGCLMIGAAVLRLGVGVLWFTTLPNLGYGSEVEISGYVMADAFERDTAAWELAQSEKPLLAAFSEYRNADQYGGMLFGSALIYRYLGGAVHQPLQIVVLTASISALSVLFTWAFARRVWDGSVAEIAAWIVALFPDAVLLGSSQMREAIMMSLVIMAFYGLVRTWQDRSFLGVIWMAAPLVIAFPLSPLFGIILVGMMVFFTVFLNGYGKINRRVWLVLLAFIIFGLLVVAVFSEQILPGGSANPLILLQRWLKQAGRWQAYNEEHASGWMQKVFDSTPVWTHTWLLLIYGVSRPFLPAALFDSAAAIWWSIAVWRSLGWVMLLPILILAPLLGFRQKSWRSPEMGLSILVWIGIFISSFRGGGDLWDNPRYRIIWIGLQGALAAWVMVVQYRNRSPWLRRIMVGMILLLVWWVPWYLRRVTSLTWPIQNVFITLALGVVSVLLYFGIEVWYQKKHSAE